MFADAPEFGGMGIGTETLTGCKSKPVGKVLLFVLQISEPFQQAYLGGSQMAWVRFMAKTHHNFGHVHLQLQGNPEAAMTVMSDEEFMKGK